MTWLDIWDMAITFGLLAAFVGLGVLVGTLGLRKQLRDIADTLESCMLVQCGIEARLVSMEMDMKDMLERVQKLQPTVEQIHKGGRRPK